LFAVFSGFFFGQKRNKILEAMRICSSACNHVYFTLKQ